MSQLLSQEELSLSLLNSVSPAEGPTIARGHYDASRLDEGKKARIRELLSKGVFSKRDIAIWSEVSFETVIAIEMEARADIRAGKQRMVKTLEIILAYNEEHLMTKAKTEGLSALEHAILIDKKELLSGNPTSRHEVIEGQGQQQEGDDYSRAVSAARTARPAGMILDAQEIRAKGPTPALEAESLRLEAKALSKPTKEAQTIEDQHNAGS